MYRCSSMMYRAANKDSLRFFMQCAAAKESFSVHSEAMARPSLRPCQRAIRIASRRSLVARRGSLSRKDTKEFPEDLRVRALPIFPVEGKSSTTGQ